MIVPSIDIMGGRTVQLVGGEGAALDCGDPFEWARSFSRTGEFALVDLDAARGTGENEALVESLCSLFACRVGGGIRTRERAIKVLDSGARSVVIGTMANPEFLAGLPRDRLFAALDTRDGEVVIEGWRKRSGRTAPEMMRELYPYVAGFLVTFVELEGRVKGTDMDRALGLRAWADSLDPELRLVIAGGVRTPEEIAIADRAGIDVQVGMALYSGELELADAFAAPLISDRADGLWPTIVCDESDRALGLAYSDIESLRASLATGRAFYRSRTRGLWEKGASSGNRQELISVGVDCDRDAIRFNVRQFGSGFCHRGTRSCFAAGGDPFSGERGIARLERTLTRRARDPVPGSYSARLFADPGLVRSKLLEEAGELAEADSPEAATREAADLVYFAAAKLASLGGSWSGVETELDSRSYRITRRPGLAKKPETDPLEKICKCSIH